MGTLIRWLRDLGAGDQWVAGGKATNLGRLLQLELPVPPGFVITVDTYHAFLALNDVAGLDPDTLHERIRSAPIPSELSVPILEAYRELGAPKVAVRSSGTAEDLGTASFAGQHDTVLNVFGPETLLDAVRACWASLWSPRAVSYRQQVGWNDQDLAIAVVVQTMVPSEWAGVLFTADPVSGRRDQMIVEAVAGLGEALVSGRVTGKRAVVEKAGLRLVDGENVLPPAALEELARMAIQIERAFGRPQDIEWAYAGGRCYLLQSRPLTALPPEKRPAVPRKPRRFSRVQRDSMSNMIDHYPIPSYPFDISLYFRPMIERLGSITAALGFAPIAVDDMMIEMTDGVYQMLPPNPRPRLGALKLPVKLLAALRVNQDAWLAECRATLVVLARQIDADDLSTLGDQELLLRMEKLQTLLLDLFFPRFVAFPRGMLSRKGLSLLVRLAGAERAGRLEGELLAGIPCTTTAINQGLIRLADRIRSSAELRQVFRDEHPDQLPVRLRESNAGRDLLAEMDDFLRQYGYRETSMLGSAFPSWRDNPGIVYGLLKGLTAAGEPANGAREPGEGDPVERASREVVAGFTRRFGPGERLLTPLFFMVRDAARSFVAYREDSHYYLFMPISVIRRLVLELGRRLAERGVLEDAEDIFFLEIDEIKQLGPVELVREIVRRRKAARQSVEGRYTPVPAELLEQTGSDGVLRGVPVSPGQAVGTARIILSEQDFWKLQPGEILVAHYTNPTWTPLFAVASAVVVDAGGTSSHAAIVAREYGIPAVMGTFNATRILRDGQRVLVNGDTGSVTPVGECVNRAGDAGVLPGRTV